MERSEMEIELYCTQCLDHTLHQITYINDKISKIECEECHNLLQVRLDIKKEFLKESYHKAMAKPQQIRKEYKKDRSDFLIRFPFRAITKPYRLVKYFNQSWKVMKAYRTNDPNYQENSNNQ
ncbi:bh protein [Gracilibacillus suaedae]|uniref:bh protein n=1 Tax=Gracilibacillus suaedae TaxID=2820273 RepID=UPI001ABE3C53|nr:bh protein [Gracilibacillus suaedae]